MMKRFALLALAGCGLAGIVASAPAEAHHYQKHGKAAPVHYGGKPGLGYWRRGPAKGYGFGFSSYKGDPFGGDDYWDGDKCYYVHHKNFCVKNRIFTGF
ncbi:MAG: hypothetical protein AB7S74_13840 [Hyphomicrobium sp.]|nr:hypothetical protein [Hyphomicrobiaceae bacterium]